MKYAVVNLGCKVNRVESDAFASSLDAHGAKSCDAADADLIVVNTCTVTGEAEKKTRKAVRGALRANDRAGAPPPSTRTPSSQWTLACASWGKPSLHPRSMLAHGDLTLRRTGPRFPLGKATVPAWA